MSGYLKGILQGMREDPLNMLKYMLMGAIGFGIGGAYWGYYIFDNFSEERWKVPFLYGNGALVLGALGGVSLAILCSKDIKKILLSSMLGVIGFFIGFLIASVLSFPLLLLSPLYLPLWILGEKAMSIPLNLPEMIVGNLFLDFAIVGAIGGLFYGLALKKNIGSMALHGAIGFGVGSLIAPLIGTLVEMVSGSLLAAYVTTFAITGVFLGLFLGLGMYLAEKQNGTKEPIET